MNESFHLWAKALKISDKKGLRILLRKIITPVLDVNNHLCEMTAEMDSGDTIRNKQESC